MRMKTRQTLAALLALVMLLALAPLGYAEGAPVTDYLQPGANKVEINLVPSGADYAEDIAGAKVQADLYLLAKAKQTEVNGTKYDSYTYVFSDAETGYTSPVASDEKDFLADLEVADPANPSSQEDVFKKFQPWAQKFAKAILTPEDASTTIAPTTTAAANETTVTVNGLDAGLYLLVLRGSDLEKSKDSEKGYIVEIESEGETEPKETTIATRALSDNYEYRFEPQLISVPTKTDESGSTYNTAYGTWTGNLEITAKASQESCAGDLKIVKTLSQFAGPDPASFVFEIKWDVKKAGGTTNTETRYAQITFDSAGTKEYTLVKTIPVGTKVTVTELHTGLQYSSEIDSATATIIASKPESTGQTGTGSTEEADNNESLADDNNNVATVEFTNDHTGPGGGSGIVNRFTADGAGNFIWSKHKGSGDPAIATNASESAS